MSVINDVKRTENNRNDALDVLKLIAAYMVVFIHFLFYGEAGCIIEALARFAVPVFFMTSGYFSYRNSTEKLKKKINHIIKIYICGVVLYFCFYSVLALGDKGIKGVLWYGFSYLNVRHIIRFILFNVPISSEHLWFLMALAYVYIIQNFVIKWKIKENIFLGCAALLLVAHLIMGVGLSLVGVTVPICLIRNFLFMGYPFFCLGILLRKKEEVIRVKVTNKMAVYMVFIGALETVISYFISGKNELYVGSVLMATGLFILALRMKNTPCNANVKKLAGTSTTIYLIHIMIGNTLVRILPTDMALWKFAFPPLVCFVSTLIALLVQKISNKLKRSFPSEFSENKIKSLLRQK